MFLKKTVDRFNFVNSLVKLGADKQHASDWAKVRNERKASNTLTAFNSLIKEMELTGLGIRECVKIAAERQWRGFEAKWFDKTSTQSEPDISEAEKRYLNK